jgi:hypothetical protein
MAGQCVTILDFISNALRKEILHCWLEKDHAVSPDAGLVTHLVSVWAPNIAEDLVRLVKGWIPGLIIAIDSPISDFDTERGDEETVSLAACYVAEPARLTVCESLQRFFECLSFAITPPQEGPLSIFNTGNPEYMRRLPYWLISDSFRLPPESVFCLSAEIGPLLLRAPRDESLVDDTLRVHWPMRNLVSRSAP